MQKRSLKVLTLQERNLIAYKRLIFPEKVNFTHRGCTFKNDPDSAITLGTSAVGIIPGRNRGIFAGFGFAELPKDIIILFSLHTITTTPTDDKNQRLYLIEVHGSYMQVHMKPLKIFGLPVS